MIFFISLALIGVGLISYHTIIYPALFQAGPPEKSRLQLRQAKVLWDIDRYQRAWVYLDQGGRELQGHWTPEDYRLEGYFKARGFPLHEQEN